MIFSVSCFLFFLKKFFYGIICAILIILTAYTLIAKHAAESVLLSLISNVGGLRPRWTVELFSCMQFRVFLISHSIICVYVDYGSRRTTTCYLAIHPHKLNSWVVVQHGCFFRAAPPNFFYLLLSKSRSWCNKSHNLFVYLYPEKKKLFLCSSCLVAVADYPNQPVPINATWEIY